MFFLFFTLLYHFIRGQLSISQEAKDVDAGVVVEVTKIGYKLHERCIRPALVGVSRN